MIRRLVVLALILIVAWMLRRLGKGSRSRSESSSARPAQPRFEGAMVRDRICETFLPRSRALSVRVDDGEHFFCSDTCRSEFLSRRRPAR